METKLELEAMANEIHLAFKSLMKSGRPDIKNEESENIIKDLYVDIFDNDYALKQVVDDNHLLMKGRRGTGKSTVFLRAEELLLESDDSIPLYLNLQTISEESPNENRESANHKLTEYLTYMNFMMAILKSMEKELENKVSWVDKEELNKVFDTVREGMKIDKDFENRIEKTHTLKAGNQSKVGGMISTVAAVIKGEYTENQSEEERTHENKVQKRIFSIHNTLNEIVELLNKEKPISIYLLLDDFSELDENSQKLLVDSLISPIISSYNRNFRVKIAAYPGRVYLGNIDSTKLPVISLDFYDAFESMLGSNKYTDIEKFAKEYIKRTLQKRIDVFTKGNIALEEIFDTDKSSIDEYMKKMFYATSCIPRAMGFILSYCFLNSINQGIAITHSHIDNAAMKYFEDNILNDFQNDIRFKQSFHDDDVILNHFAQINLKNKLVENSKSIKKEVVKSYNNNSTKKLFKEVLDKKRGSAFYFPTSHFFVNSKREKLLNTLELYFIITKYNQGSSRNSSDRESFYALNYGLCVRERIDFGKPENMRRTYDYWRQEEFNYNEFITNVLSSIEEIKCNKCGEIYTETEYEIYQKYENCFKCQEHGSVIKVNKFADRFKSKIDEWNKNTMPDVYVDMLRVLFNNREIKLSAYQIAEQIDKHHLTVTHAGNGLKQRGLLTYEVSGKRYYSITDKAISDFFTNNLDV